MVIFANSLDPDHAPIHSTSDPDAAVWHSAKKVYRNQKNRIKFKIAADEEIEQKTIFAAG